MWSALPYINEEDLQQYRQAAERAWSDDTRHALYRGDPIPSSGQCYVTSKWLTEHLGGHVGSKGGHYFWVNPEGTAVIDLTADQFCQDHPRLASTDDPPYRGFRVIRENPVNARTSRFIKRANRELNRREDEAYKIALDYAGDAFPGSTPQAEADREQDSIDNPYWHDEPNKPAGSGTYQFFFGNGQLHVSPLHDHDELAGHAQVDDDHSGPVAVGYVNVQDSRATWDVHSNVSIHALQKVLQDYSKQVGWEWGGLCDIEGEPIGTGSEFAPSKSSSMPFRFIGSHLYVGKEGTRDLDLVEGWLRKQAKNQELKKFASKWLSMSLNGNITCDDYYAVVEMGSLPDAFKYASEEEALNRFSNFIDALKDWCEDQGLQPYIAREDNLIKNYDFLDLHNLGDPNATDFENHQYFPPPVDDTEVSQGIYRCPGCDRLFPSYFELERHRRQEEPLGDQEPRQNNDIPEADMAPEDQPSVHFTEQQPEGATPFAMPTASIEEAKRVDGFETYSKLWNLDEPDLTHYIAYKDGCAIGFASLKDDELVMMHEAEAGANKALMALLQRHYDELKSEAPTQEVTRTLKQSGWAQASSDYWKWSQGQSPTDMLQDSIPFVYDVDEDSIFVGQPGARHSDIHGQFTPGGVVEGTYEPGGNVLISSSTDMPFTVRHMLELWYFQHPELEIKSVAMQDDSGEQTKLAKNIGHHVAAQIAANPAAYRATRLLQGLGAQVYAVGPVVRNVVLGAEAAEVPFLVPVYLDDKFDPYGDDIQFALEKNGHVTPSDDPYTYAPWLFEQAYSSVRISGPETDIETVLSWQPFTSNAVAVNLNDVSVVGDLTDIQTKTLRPLHLAGSDWARHGMYLASLGFNASEKLQEAYKRAKIKFSTDDLREMLEVLISAENPSGAIRFAHDVGMLEKILPEVSSVWRYSQDNEHHHLELGQHLLAVLNSISWLTKDPDLRLAGLLHDIGKPDSRWEDEEGKAHYYASDDGQGFNHEEVGARMVRARLYELGFSEERIERISKLVEFHMFPYFTTQKGARKFLAKTGEYADDLIKLRQADSDGKRQDVKHVSRAKSLLRDVRHYKQPHKHAHLAINGHDLLKEGMETGPDVGAVLDLLAQFTVKDPSVNTREKLTALARGIIRDAELPVHD